MSLIVKNSKIHGRGCFTNRKIKEGKKFTFPIIKIKPCESDHLFPWEGKKYKSIVIGAPTFCNDSERPNFKIHDVNRNKLTKTFIALRDIDKGEEIFLNYKM